MGVVSAPGSHPNDGMRRAMELVRPSPHGVVSLIDVGAHKGETLREFSSWPHDSKFYAGFEINPGLVKGLRSALARNSASFCSSSVHHAAVSDRDGETVFVETRASMTGGLLEPHPTVLDRVSSGHHAVIGRHMVPSLKLDTFIAANFELQNLVVKLDMEGAEIVALRGMEESLRQQIPAVVLSEVFFVNYRNGQGYFWDVASFLHQFGYFFDCLYDERLTDQGRLYTGNAIWVNKAVAKREAFG